MVGPNNMLELLMQRICAHLPSSFSNHFLTNMHTFLVHGIKRAGNKTLHGQQYTGHL